MPDAPAPDADPDADLYPRPDAPDTERTDTAAFGGEAAAALELGRAEQLEQLRADEDAPQTPENQGANTDDETPPLEPDESGAA
jgi:hypothetical protein